MRSEIRSTRFARLLLPSALAAILGLAAAFLPAQEQEPFSEAEVVTAVDVLVELATDQRKLPWRLEAGDFRVRLDGEAQVAVALADPRKRADLAETDPWRLVLYFDLATSTTHTVRWAATSLAERADRLLELGEVEIVVGEPADGAATTVLAATRDAEAVRGALSALAIEGLGANELVTGRAVFLAALHDERAVDASVSAPELAREEANSLGRRLDQLLLHLTESRGPSSARAVLLVSDGFDLEPGKFYDGWIRRSGLAAPRLAPGVAEELGRRVDSLGATLAAYGWVVLPVAPPDPGPGLLPGWRIGKWRFGGTPEGPVGGFVATLEERRKPEDAEGFLELAAARTEAGELEEAREAFERALYHFAGDPRTASSQAEAQAGLGRTLEALGEMEAAREAFHDAVALDPKWAQEFPAAQAELAAPLEPLERLVRTTVGRLVDDEDTLDKALGDLADRLRLTYQVTGWPDGRLLPLTLALDRPGYDLRAPRWARSGTPPSVAEARVRRLVWGELVEGDLALVVAREGGELTATLELPPALSARQGEAGRPLLVTLALGGPDGEIRFRHQRPRAALEPDRSGEWLYRASVPPPAEAVWVALVVEDLASGRWGAALLED